MLMERLDESFSVVRGLSAHYQKEGNVDVSFLNKAMTTKTTRRAMHLTRTTCPRRTSGKPLFLINLELFLVIS